MSSPQTSPSRYGANPKTQPPQRTSTPDNLLRRLGGTANAKQQIIDVMIPTVNLPDDITMIPDPTPVSSAEAWSKFKETGVKYKPISNAIVIDAAAVPTFSP